jgi:hypothetical protein
MSLLPQYNFDPYALGQNPFKVSGEYMPFLGPDISDVYSLDVFDEDKKPDGETKTKSTGDPFTDYLIKKDQQAEKDKKYYRSKEYLRTQAELADEIAARQMARAQKYGERSAMLGFLYKGLPNMVKDMKFAKYAGADAALAGIRDNFGRISTPQVTTGRYFQNMPLIG